jgi:PAS domain S-box-containing protein
MSIPIALSDWKGRLRLHFDRTVEQKWINVGLRAKMGAMVVVGLVGLTIIFALLGISTARHVTQQVLSERMMLARLSAASLDSMFRHVESMLAVVADQEALRGPQASPAERDAALRTGFDQIAIFSQGVYLFDMTGRPLTSVTKMERSIDWTDAAAVKNVLHGERSSVSIVPGDQPWVVMAVPVFDGTNEPIGALAAVLDLTDPDISPFERPFDLGRTGTLDVVDADGLILISTHSDRILTISDQADLLSELFVADEPRVETCVGCYAEESPEPGDQVMAFAPMSQAPWGVVVRQDSNEVLAPVRSFTLNTCLLGMAAVIGALGLVWITTSSVIAPVQLLTDAAKRIAEGDMATPICCRRGDEIGDLAVSFDAMRAQLKSSMDEIQAWNRELDARVQERTQAALAAQLEAQHARDDLRAIIDGLSDELIVVGLDFRVQQVNKAAQQRRGNGKDLVGDSCYKLFHNEYPCEPPDCECPIALVLATGDSVKVTHAHRNVHNGEKRYLDVVASPMRDSMGRITRIVELLRDVTDEKKIEESLVRRNQQLAILNAVSTTVNQSLNLEDILGRALDEVLRLTEIDVGAIFLQEETLSNLELLAYRGLSEEAAHLASRLGMLDGSCGGVLEAGQIIVVPDLSRYRGRRADSLKREKLSTLVHVPLTAKGCILGSMCVGTHRQREFGPEEQELLTAIGSQIAVAIENARLYAEVQHKEQLRGQLLKKVIAVQEEERKRIARELHDDTSQALTALLYAAEEGMDMSELAEVKEMLEGMRDLTVRTLDGVHKLTFDLRPTMLDHLGLVPALRWLVQSRLEPTGVRVTIEEKSSPRRLPNEVETALFRVVQEAITNIARHAAARNVYISFHFDDEAAMVYVKDDGIGFDMVELALSPDSGRGLGLMGMHERVELLEGEVEIITAPGYGTQVHIRVPIGERKGIYA